MVGLSAQAAAELVERRPHAAVESVAAHVGDEATDEFGSDLGFEQNLFAGRLLERGLDSAGGGRIERGRRQDLCADAIGRLVCELAVVKIDLLDADDAAAIEH